MTDAHSSLSTGWCHHLIIFISCRFFSASSIHLSQGLPILLPSGLLKYFLNYPSMMPWPFQFFFQCLPLCWNLYIAPAIRRKFLFSVFLVLLRPQELPRYFIRYYILTVYPSEPNTISIPLVVPVGTTGTDKGYRWFCVCSVLAAKHIL